MPNSVGASRWAVAEGSGLIFFFSRGPSQNPVGESATALARRSRRPWRLPGESCEALDEPKIRRGIEVLEIAPTTGHDDPSPRPEVLDSSRLKDQLLQDILASGVLGLIARDRLLLFSMVKYRASTLGCAQLTTGHVTAVERAQPQTSAPKQAEHLGARRAGLNSGEVDHLIRERQRQS